MYYMEYYSLMLQRTDNMTETSAVMMWSIEARISSGHSMSIISISIYVLQCNSTFRLMIHQIPYVQS